MQLNETLTAIAAQIGCDAVILISYAAEDNIGGYHNYPQYRSFPAGSIWQCEGQILYALVRHLKPEKVVEIGGWAGGSASHLASAVKVNGKGHVYSIDDGSEFSDFEHGYLIPENLRQYITLIKDDGRVWLAKQDPQSIGLLFDDASHAASLIIELARLALQKVYPTGVLVNHDAMHDAAYYPDGSRTPSPLGRQVRDALTNAGLYFTPYLTEPSDCGLAITVVPGVRMDKQSEPMATEESINNQAEVVRVTDSFNQPPKEGDGTDFYGRDEKGDLAIRGGTHYLGNDNIESVSEPPVLVEFQGIQNIEKGFVPNEPPPLQAQEEQTESKPVEKKPRGKGGRKPKVQ